MRRTRALRRVSQFIAEYASRYARPRARLSFKEPASRRQIKSRPARLVNCEHWKLQSPSWRLAPNFPLGPVDTHLSPMNAAARLIMAARLPSYLALLRSAPCVRLRKKVSMRARRRYWRKRMGWRPCDPGSRRWRLDRQAPCGPNRCQDLCRQSARRAPQAALHRGSPRRQAIGGATARGNFIVGPPMDIHGTGIAFPRRKQRKLAGVGTRAASGIARPYALRSRQGVSLFAAQSGEQSYLMAASYRSAT
jgi:hypothetical protein